MLYVRSLKIVQHDIIVVLLVIKFFFFSAIFFMGGYSIPHLNNVESPLACFLKAIAFFEVSNFCRTAQMNTNIYLEISTG
jgi:hypothetical protein